MKEKKEEKVVNTTEEKIDTVNSTFNQNDNVNEKTNHLIKINLLNFLEKQLQESNDKILVDQLDFEKEIKKIQDRLEREIEKNRKFCLEKIIFSFLPIIDNIERALNALNTLEKNKKVEFNCLIIQKLNVTFQLLENILQAYNVRKINDQNVIFNPDIHQAMSIQSSNDIPPNHVITVMQSGYIFHESRLLRPAMVIVSQKK